MERKQEADVLESIIEIVSKQMESMSPQVFDEITTPIPQTN